MVTSIYIGKKKLVLKEELAEEGQSLWGSMAWGDGEKTPGAWLARNSLGLFFFSWPGCSRKGDESPDYLTISQTTWGLCGGDVSASA